MSRYIVKIIPLEKARVSNLSISIPNIKERRNSFISLSFYFPNYPALLSYP